MKRILFCFLAFCFFRAGAQELYVYSEPASNMPTHSISARVSSVFIAKNRSIENRFMQRYIPELMFGLSKNWMVHVGGTFADMHTRDFRWESVYTYAKFRFLSVDDIHSHFRMAAFLDASYTRSPFHYDEVSLQGDKSGLQAGIIATQLWNKLAVSTTISHTQVLHESRNSKTLYIPSRIYQAMNYSLSAGYLVLPVEYRNYRQTNLNVYAELLAQQSLDRKTHYIDFAPALQLIFNSTSKLNLGHRFQVGGNMQRMTQSSWLVSYERIFLNALKKKK